MQGYVQRAEVLKIIKSTMPVRVEYEDPMRPGATIQCHRDDILALLVLGDDAQIDSQWVAALYAEMARFEKAAILASEKADMEYARWKAKASNEWRAAKDAAKEKYTVDQAKDSYRDHAKYEEMSMHGAVLRAQAGVFEGIKKALDIKSGMLKAALYNVAGHERAHSAEVAGDRYDDLASLQRDATAVAVASVEDANRLAASVPSVVGPPQRRGALVTE